MSRILDKAVFTIALLMVAYHAVSTQFLLPGQDAVLHQAFHLGFSLVLVLLASLKAAKGWRRWTVLLTLLFSLVSMVYIKVNYIDLSFTRMFPDTLDCIIGIILVIAVLEATRKAWGLALPIVGALSIIYLFWGHLLSGPLRHAPLDVTYAISYLSIGFQGIFGTILGASANYIFLFIVFGGLFEIVGIRELFVEVGKIAGRRLAGGPAQTAMISSGLVGMCTGAAVANVAITGSFTIPMMKKIGYTPEQAASIEAYASTGGQYMPPVMGASVFVMAAMLGIAYTDIMIPAFIPAFLFFLSGAIGVQLMALRYRIPRIREKVDNRTLLRRAPLFIIPIAVLMTLLLMRFSPMYAAFYAILAIIVVSLIQKETRPSLGRLAEGFKNGAVMGAKIGVACACIGLLSQVLTTTGLGQKLVGLMETLSGGHLIIALILTMFISILLGTGVPTVAAYVLVAAIGAPVLIRMGVTPLPAHFFIFYFAVISALTPPVAMAALAGSAIAGGSYFKTSMQAFRLGLAGFVLPFFFAYNLIFLLGPTDPVWGSISIVGLLLTMVAFHAANFGYMLTDLSPQERVLSFLAGGMLGASCIIHNYILLGAGLLLFLGLCFWQWRKRGKLEEYQANTGKK